MATDTAGSNARDLQMQVVQVFRKNFTFANADETITLGKVPAGSIIDDAYVIVSTAFNSGTSDTLDVGTDGDPNGFATLLDLTTVGKIVWDEFATSNDLGPAAAADVVQFTYNSTGTAPTAGSGEVVVKFISDVDG